MRKFVLTLLLFVRINFLLAETVFPSLNDLSLPITFLGNYGDGRDETISRPRAMPFQFAGITYTPETCFKLAEENYYNFFGMQYGGECWVTNNITSAKRYGLATNEGIELLPCRNDTAVICGGPLINSVYALDNPFYSFSPTSTPTVEPSVPTCIPSYTPTAIPTVKPSIEPTYTPSAKPSYEPSIRPSAPTVTPTIEPSAPTYVPSFTPSYRPSISHTPTISPTSATNSRSSSASTLDAGAAAGIAVSLFVVLCVCFPVLFLLCCGSRFAKKDEDDEEKNEDGTIKPHNETAYADDGVIERNAFGILGSMAVNNNSNNDESKKSVGGGTDNNNNSSNRKKSKSSGRGGNYPSPSTSANPMRNDTSSVTSYNNNNSDMVSESARSTRGLMEDENSSFA